MEQKIRDEFEQLTREYGIDAITPKMLKDRALGKRKIAIKAEKKQPEVRIVDFIQRFIDDTKRRSSDAGDTGTGTLTRATVFRSHSTRPTSRSAAVLKARR